MINYLAALAVVSVIGALLGAVLARSELRRAERVYTAARDELERLATARSAVNTESTTAPAE